MESWIPFKTGERGTQSCLRVLIVEGLKASKDHLLGSPGEKVGGKLISCRGLHSSANLRGLPSIECSLGIRDPFSVAAI